MGYLTLVLLDISGYDTFGYWSTRPQKKTTRPPTSRHTIRDTIRAHKIFISFFFVPASSTCYALLSHACTC